MNRRCVTMFLMCCDVQRRDAPLSEGGEAMARHFGEEYLRDKRINQVGAIDAIAAWPMALLAMGAGGYRHLLSVRPFEEAQGLTKLLTTHPAFASPAKLLMKLLSSLHPDVSTMILGAGFGNQLLQFADSLADGAAGLLVLDAVSITFGVCALTGGNVLNDIPPFGMVELELTFDDQRALESCVITRASVDYTPPPPPPRNSVTG